MVHRCEVVDRGAELERDREAADDVARASGDDVDAEYSAARPVENDLVEAVLGAEVLCARHRFQRLLDDVDLMASMYWPSSFSITR